MQPNTILYSFRRCPFAMRARWSILLSGKVVTLREVSLSHKPIELLDCSPKGTVPVLIPKNEHVIDESIEIMRWALSAKNPFNGLRTKDAYAQSKIKKLIYQNDYIFKYHLDRFKYSSRYPDADKELERNLAREILISWSNRIAVNSSCSSQGWLIDDSESLADWAIWPFVRQYRIADPKTFEADQEIKPLKEWINFYLNHPLFNSLMYKTEPWKSGDPPKLFPPPHTS